MWIGVISVRAKDVDRGCTFKTDHASAMHSGPPPALTVTLISRESGHAGGNEGKGRSERRPSKGSRKRERGAES